MIVTLDAQRLDTPVEPDCTLQSLLECVRNAHRDRLIVSVSVDGQHLGDDELQTALARPMPAAAQIDLETGNTQEVIRDALRGLAQEFKQAADRLAELSQRVTNGQSGDALRDIGDYIGLWQTAHRMLGQCSGLLGEELLDYLYDGRLVRTYFEEVVGRLTEIRQALETRDLVLLTDLVRYELPPLCETWQTLLADLAEQVHVTPQPA
jgi:hypothetical protein